MTLRTPQPPSLDPDTGNTRPGAVTVTETAAWLAQRAIRDTSFSEEDSHRGYTSSLYSLLVPPAAPLTAQTQVVDAAGATYEVEGDPAVRYRGFTTEPLFLAASLRRLSDRQEA